MLGKCKKTNKKKNLVIVLYGKRGGKWHTVMPGHLVSTLQSGSFSADQQPPHWSQSTRFPSVVHCLGSTVDWGPGGRGAAGVGLHQHTLQGMRYWASCRVTPQPVHPSQAPFRLRWGSVQSAVSGWSPEDWGGRGWSNRDGLPGRRMWGRLPRELGRRTEGRNCRRMKPEHHRRYSRATDIPNALLAGGRTNVKISKMFKDDGKVMHETAMEKRT